MYSIGTIIYGVPITDEVYARLKDMDIEAEELGFETLYHGGSDRTVGYFGFEITEFDECEDITFSRLTKKVNGVTHARKDRIDVQIAELDQKVKEIFDDNGRTYDPTIHKIQDVLKIPDVYIVFSTS